MTKQELAQKRNYLKFRLIGTSALFKDLSSALTTEELNGFNIISTKLTKLILDWDSNSELKGLDIKPYKCKFCGKRSSKANYMEECGNLCSKCLKLFNESKEDEDTHNF